MLSICCRKSKKGNEFIALCYDDIILTFDERVIFRVANACGYAKRDIYNLSVGEYLEIA